MAVAVPTRSHTIDGDHVRAANATPDFTAQPITTRLLLRDFKQRGVTLIPLQGTSTTSVFLGSSSLKNDLAHLGVVTIYLFHSPIAASTYATINRVADTSDQVVVRAKNMIGWLPKRDPGPVMTQIRSAIRQVGRDS